MRQIAPRHFYQTGESAGIGRQTIESILDELHEGALTAVDSVLSKLPREFPEEIASSISDGIKRRVHLLREPSAEM
jgi:serine/threonine-protein kinase HipA